MRPGRARCPGGVRRLLRTLTGRIAVYFALLFILPYSLMAAVLAHNARQAAVDRAIHDQTLLMEQARSAVVNTLVNAGDLCDQLYANRYVRAYLLSDLRRMNVADYQNFTKVLELTSFATMPGNGIRSLSLTRVDGYGIVAGAGALLPVDEVVRRLDAPGARPYGVQGGVSCEAGRLSIIRVFSDITRDRVIGYLCVDVMAATLGVRVASLSDDAGRAYALTDGDGAALLASDEALLPAILSRTDAGVWDASALGRRYLAISRDVGFAGLRLHAFLPYDALSAGIAQSLAYPLLTCAAAMSFVIGLSVLLSRRIARPLHVLIAGMRGDQAGDRPLDVPPDSILEIRQLAGTYNELLGRIQAGQQARLDMEINALQSQINPHFIYNTLSSIRLVALMRSDGLIVSMLDAFIALMQYCANFKQPMIALEQEEAFLRQYLYIGEIRYAAPLNVDIAFAPDTLGLYIPRFVVQPLLENAIFHGLKGSAQRGAIRVDSAIDGDRLRIRVVDDGCGMDAQTLRLAERPADDRRMSGIGLANVAQRVKRFGAEYGLSIDSAPGRGCAVTVWLPIVRQM
ncbi:MAG: sensor histidine kinase [Clostridiales bacterium]|nr:sensor histidine kinase [Clostridiales bacterium]